MDMNLLIRAIEEHYADELESGQLCAAWHRGAAAGLERAKHFDLAIDVERDVFVVVRKGELAKP